MNRELGASTSDRVWVLSGHTRGDDRYDQSVRSFRWTAFAQGGDDGRVFWQSDGGARGRRRVLAAEPQEAPNSPPITRPEPHSGGSWRIASSQRLP